MNFYLGKNQIPVSIETQPTLVKAQDTTNDTFNCVLKVNTDPIPIKPMTPFKVIYDDETTQVFWVINDSVTVFSLNPKSYKHSLTLVQYRYFLNKHLLRNTVFNQPKEMNRKMYTSFSEAVCDVEQHYKISVNSLDRIWYEDLTIRKPSRLRSFAMEIKVHGIFFDFDNETGDMRELDYNAIRNLGYVGFNSESRLRIIDISNNDTLVSEINLFNHARDIGDTVYLNFVKEDINEYLETHQNAKLRATYYANSNDMVDACFIKKSQNLGNAYMEAFFFQITFFTELYNYTFYDVIQTLLNQYRLTSDNFGSKRELLFNLPTANSTGEDLELYNLLTTTYPPDTLAFTQTTFYEALSEIFRFFDAGFKFDENKTLKIEYYNEFKNEFNKGILSTSSTQADRNYCKNKISEYQNALQEIKMNNIPTRANTLGVPGQTDYALVLQKPIYSIESITIKIPSKLKMSTASWLYVYEVGIPNLDLTPFFINSEIWSTLPSSVPTTDWINQLQKSTVPYTRGEKYINLSTYFKEWLNLTYAVLEWVLKRAVSRFMGISSKAYETGSIRVDDWTPLEDFSQAWSEQRFNIKYFSEMNGRLQIETVTNQYNGEILNNQSAAQVDISKLGLSILMESLKNGEPILSASCEITKWQHRPIEGDYFIDKDGIKWIANVVNYTLLPNGNEKCSIEFTRNFNLLALRVNTDHQKRLTQISREIASMSEDNYVDYIYVTDNIADLDLVGESIVLNANVLRGVLRGTFLRTSSPESDIEFCSIRKSSALGNITGCYVPIIKYGAGNCICFETQCDDPISVGNRLMATASESWGTNYFSEAVLYADNDGWLDDITLSFCREYTNVATPALSTYPYVLERLLYVDLVDTIGQITNLKYYKKPNEVFALNYEWCFLTLPKQINQFFIGNKFIIENFATKKDKMKGKEFYLWYTTIDSEGKYSILDIKGIGTIDENSMRNYVITITNSGNVTQMSIRLPLDYGEINAKTWAICDENNDIYFASNNPTTFSENADVVIYFVTRRQRVEDDETLTEI